MATGKEYILSFLIQTKGDKIHIKTLKTIKAEHQKIGASTKKTTRHTNDFIKALRRVAIVVPVWFAFRQTMLLVVNTIKAATEEFIELESNLARAAAVTSNQGMEMSQAMRVVGDVAQDFARKHKGASKDVIEAYYRMATSGLDFEDAIMGAVPATKLAVATYGDVASTAKTVSAIYRLLGDSIDGVSTKQEKMTKITDVLGRAWQSHEIEINEIAQAIANAGGSAAAFGIKFEELITLLSVSSDALIKSGRAGRLFGRTLDEMARKLPAVKAFLGEAFDSNAPLDWFQILLKIVNKFRSLGKSTEETEKALSSMFNIRSSRQLRAFIIQAEKIDTTLYDLKNNSKGTTEYLLKLADATNKVQLENLRENVAIIGADFLTGFTEATNFTDALIDINSQLSEMGMQAVGAGAGLGKMYEQLRAIWRLGLKGTKSRKPKNELDTIFGTAPGFNLWNLLRDVTTNANLAQDLGTTHETPFEVAGKAMEKYVKRTMELRKQQEARRNQRLKDAGLISDENKLETDTTKIVSNKLKLQGQINANETQLFNLINRRKSLLEQLPEKGSERTGLPEFKELTKIEQQIASLESQRKNLLDQVLIQQSAQDGLVDQQNKELETLYKLKKLQQDITDEIKNQRNVSSETVQLWKVAQRLGSGTASRFAKILGGQRSFKGLGRRQQALFSQFFSGKAEQFQAYDYFFKGAGRGIDIPEREERARRREELERQLVQVAPSIPVDIKSTINVNIDSEQINTKIKDAIAKEFDKQNYSPLVRKLKKQIEEY